ncbi:MAG: flavin reductase family protein [Microbacterium sp.]
MPILDADAMSSDDFRAAFRNHPAGVAIVTADIGEGPVAMTVTSVSSVSAVPPLLIFSASGLSSSTPTFRQAETVVVHLVDSENLDLAQLAATSNVNRFPEGRWERLDTGEPIYPEIGVRIRGKIVNRLDVGTSTIFVIEGCNKNTTVSQASGPEESSRPLVFHNRTWHALGPQSTL